MTLLDRLWRRRGVRFEIENLVRAIERTEHEIAFQIEWYAKSPCCPSCGSFASEPVGRRIVDLRAKNDRRRTRLAQLQKKR